MRRAEAREVAAAERPLGLLEQLLEPLVAAVDGLEERDRIGRVDEHRAAPARRPRRTPGRAARRRAARARRSSSRMPEPEVLPDLEAARAGVARAPQALDEHVGVEARAADGAQVDVAERDEAAGVRAVVAVEVALELVAPEAVEVDDRLDAHLVEQSRSARRRRRPPRAARRRARARPGRAPASRPTAPSQRPRWLCASTAGTSGSGTSVSGSTSRDCGSQSSSSGGHSLMQAARWPAAGASCGSTARQESSPIGQRGWKRQPARDVDRVRRLALQDLRAGAGRAGRGAARPRSAPACTGAAGCRRPSRAGPSSTMRPRYMTRIRSA